MVSHLENPFYYLRSVADNIGLDDREEGIRRVFFTLYFLKPGSTKEIAKVTRLPLPIAAAIRKEFENNGILQRETGLQLTNKGKELSRNIFQIPDISLDLETGIAEKIKREISDMLSERPNPDRKLDQSHSTIETQLKRVQLMINEDSIIGRDIGILGDDDLTSIAICIYLRHLSNSNNIPCKISVFECDERIINFINNFSSKYNYPIKAYIMDLRNKLKTPYIDVHDTVFTDPPYTTKGVALFLSRGLDMLKWGVSKKIFLSLPRIKRDNMLKIQKDISSMHLLIESFYQGFNKYQGNSIYANLSDIYILSTCHTSKPLYQDSIDMFDQLYTYDFRPKKRLYKCNCCNKLFDTARKEYTIDILKSRGCDICGNKIFNRIDSSSIDEQNK